MLSNTIGTNNTAIGIGSLSVSNGNNNTAVGFSALANNATGSSNIALGPLAGINLTTGSNNIVIGNVGMHGESNTIRISKQGTQKATFMAGVSGTSIPTGLTVVVDSTGHLGTTSSSARFKEDIKPMEKASEAIFSLKPVAFRYRRDLDPKATPHFALVAEGVAKINADLVARDEQGKPYTVRYEAVNAMLLNEFLKEHHQVQDLKAIVTEQQKQIDALTAGLQKVRTELGPSKVTPQLVATTK